jgi:monoamine oxidase
VNRLAQLQKPDNRIFVGCAAASTRPAWIQGAFEASWNAVKQLHERAMRA